MRRMKSCKQQQFTVMLPSPPFSYLHLSSLQCLKVSLFDVHKFLQKMKIVVLLSIACALSRSPPKIGRIHTYVYLSLIWLYPLTSKFQGEVWGSCLWRNVELPLVVNPLIFPLIPTRCLQYWQKEKNILIIVIIIVTGYPSWCGSIFRRLTHSLLFE